MTPHAFLFGKMSRATDFKQKKLEDMSNSGPFPPIKKKQTNGGGRGGGKLTPYNARRRVNNSIRYRFFLHYYFG